MKFYSTDSVILFGPKEVDVYRPSEIFANTEGFRCMCDNLAVHEGSSLDAIPSRDCLIMGCGPHDLFGRSSVPLLDCRLCNRRSFLCMNCPWRRYTGMEWNYRFQLLTIEKCDVDYDPELDSASESDSGDHITDYDSPDWSHYSSPKKPHSNLFKLTSNVDDRDEANVYCKCRCDYCGEKSVAYYYYEC